MDVVPVSGPTLLVAAQVVFILVPTWLMVEWVLASLTTLMVMEATCVLAPTWLVVELTLVFR